MTSWFSSIIMKVLNWSMKFSDLVRSPTKGSGCSPISFLHPAGAAAVITTAGGPGGGGGEGDCDGVEGVVGVVDLVNEDLDANPTIGGGDGMRSPASTAAAI